MRTLQKLLYVRVSSLMSLFQHDSTTVEVNEGVNGCEKDDEISVVPEEEEEPVEQLEQQQRYPRRQRTMPVRYGVEMEHNLHGAATRICQGRRVRSRLQIEKITKTVFQMLEHSLKETHGVY